MGGHRWTIRAVLAACALEFVFCFFLGFLADFLLVGQNFVLARGLNLHMRASGKATSSLGRKHREAHNAYIRSRREWFM